MIKGWKYGKATTSWIERCKSNYGCVYVAKIPVIQGFYLLKIGATSSPKTCLQSFTKRSTILAISKPHLNFWENEEILHKYFDKYRVPKRPKNNSQAELFNISLKYFFQNLPELNFCENEEETYKIKVKNYKLPVFMSK